MHLTLILGCWMLDINLGELFLNLSLDAAEYPYASVNLSPYFGDVIPSNWS
jgi:hypothetical protein